MTSGADEGREPTDALLAFWGEQREQLRHTEDQRSTLTNYILVLVTAGTGLIVQQKFVPATAAVAGLIALLGLYGALAGAKFHERAVYHLHQARALTRSLVAVGALPDATEVDSERQRHYQKYPWLSRLRLHWLWTGLHLAITVYGVVLLVVIAAR